MAKNIVHLEDDPHYAGLIRAELKDYAAKAKTEIAIRRYATEKEFRQKIGDIAEWGDVFVLDVMVRWSFPGEEGKIPAEVEEDGYYLAGCRCTQLLLGELAKCCKKVVLYTVYLADELKDEVKKLNEIREANKLVLITKGEDLAPLWNEIKAG